MKTTQPTEKPQSEWAVYREKEQIFIDTIPLKITCAFCGKIFEGESKKTRDNALTHRTKKHPQTLDAPRRRRKSARALHTFRYTGMDEESKAEIDAERRRRARLNGVALEE